jgi:hypothetical protein
MNRRWELLLRALGSTWRLAILAVASVVAIWAVSYFYLVPAMDGYRTADPAARRMIRALSTLLLVLMLGFLAVGMWWTLRRRP